MELPKLAASLAENTMKLKLSLVSMIAITSAVLLGATAAYAAPPDACSLLTPAQVRAALGEDVGTGQSSAAGKICQWSASTPPKPGAKRVILTLQSEQTFAYAKAPVQNANITKTPVSGVGDDAVSGTTRGAGTTLTVKKGTVVFSVRVSGLPDDDTKTQEKALALDVLAKL